MNSNILVIFLFVGANKTLSGSKLGQRCLDRFIMFRYGESLGGPRSKHYEKNKVLKQQNKGMFSIKFLEYNNVNSDGFA